MLSIPLLAGVLALCVSASVPAAGPVIKIEKVDRTADAIVLTGKADVVPVGTRFSAKVLSINGKPLRDPTRMIIAATEKVEVASDRRFEARLQRWGSLNAFDFPVGTYEVEFTAFFNANWQSPEVLKAAGVAVDEQGRTSLNAEPKGLPASPDLKRERGIGGEMVRTLSAVRTVSVKQLDAPGALGRTKSIRIEVHDTSPSAPRNPIRTIPADGLLQRDVKTAVGKVTPTQSVVLACVGPFPAGYIASDLYYSGGRPNRELVGEFATTLKETCLKMERSCSQCK